MACSAPPPLSDEQLSMLVDGMVEEDTAVAQHLAQCAFCTGRLQRLRQWDAALTQRLYRFECPSPEQLGDYHLNLLPDDTATSVRAHVADCPRCQDDLAMLVRFLDTPFEQPAAPAAPATIIPLYPAYNVIPATRVVGSNVLKGADDEVTYDVTAGSARVYIEMRHTADTIILTGQVIDQETQWAGGMAQLHQGATPPLVQTLDDMSEFRFDLPRPFNARSDETAEAAEVDLYITSANGMTIVVEHISTRKP